MGHSAKVLNSDRKLADKLSLEVIENEHDFDALADEWEQLVEHSDVHIFQTFEWQRTWWKFFGGDNDLQILLFRQDNKLVGIMPMFLDCFNVMGFTVYRCLRMIGSRVLQPKEGSLPVELAFSDYLSLIALPGYETEITETLKEYMESHKPLYDEMILEEIPEESALLSSLVPQFNSADWSSSVQNASVCPQIELPGSWNDFLMGLSSNARYQIRRFIRRATEKNIFELHTAHSKEEVTQAFEDLVEFHQTRWHRLGQPGIFMDDRIHGFFREITMRFHEKGWLFIKTATARKQCVAVDLLFKFKGIIYMVQRGFDDTCEYKTDSPGKVLLYAVIKEAIEDGLKMYDFLRGQERYKFRAATHIPQNKKITIRKAKHREGTRAWANDVVQTYSHLRGKIRNERNILQVYKKREKSIRGMSSYLEALYQRMTHKIKNIERGEKLLGLSH